MLIYFFEYMEEKVCCPRINPKDWQEKEYNWTDKIFIKGKVFTFMFMPFNFGSVIAKLMNRVTEAKATTLQNICLSDHTSMWNMDIYIEVSKEIPGVENIKLSGQFLSKIYEGDFKDTGIWCKNFEEYITKTGKKLDKMYLWYTTCPKCAKKYGKNYTVIFGKIS